MDIELLFSELLTKSMLVDVQKERIETIRNMQVIIFPNDHLPAHFHVKSNDRSINAKFKISNGEYISGEITNKQSKQIQSFCKSPMGKSMLEKVWKKYHG